MKSLSTYLKLICLLIILSSNSLLSQWEKCTWPGAAIKFVVTKGNNVFAGTDNGVYLSKDSGNTWTQMNNGLTGLKVTGIVISGEMIFAGLEEVGVFLSTNNGDSWSAVNTGLHNGTVICMAIVGSTIVVGTDQRGVYTSPLNEIVWTEFNNGIWDLTFKNMITIADKIFAGTIKGIFVGSNKGTSWELLGIEDDSIDHLYNIDSCNFAFISYQELFSCKNNGTNWTKTSLNFPATFHLNSFLIYGKNIFAGTFGKGVYLSTDNGTNWNEANNGLTSKLVSSLFTIGNNVFVSFTGSLFKLKIDAFTDIEDLPKTSSTTLLFPNPAQNTLNIRLDKESAVASSVRILDVCGRTVAESQIPAGTKDFSLDLKELPVGVYLFNLVTGNEVKTEKFGVWR